jgi:hypothetical protein
MPTLRPDTDLLRVMTWNVWWRFGPWERRRRAILEVLRRERPDVVGLQEVWAGRGENLAEWLGAKLGMHVVFAAVEKPHRWSARFSARFDDESFEIGNAVLSRWPVAESAALRLDVPESPDAGLRGCRSSPPTCTPPGLVLIDMWELAGPTAPSVTWDRANPYVASAFPVSARIEHIRVGPPGPGLRGAVRAVRRAGDGPVHGVWPSDHAAVVADLQL